MRFARDTLAQMFPDLDFVLLSNRDPPLNDAPLTLYVAAMAGPRNKAPAPLIERAKSGTWTPKSRAPSHLLTFGLLQLIMQSSLPYAPAARLQIFPASTMTMRLARVFC